MAANTFDIDDNNEEFCLRWKTFSTTISSEFKTLKDDDDFVDVTIACTGKLLGAHKLVLSACSPYFKHIFKSNPCKHPVLLMLDVDAKQMQSVLQFMYCGEVNVTRNDLPQFLRIASYLQIRGLDEKQKEAAELEAQQQEASTVMPAVPYVNDVPQQSSDEIIVNKEDEVEPVYDNELLEPKVENEFDDVVIEDYDIPEEHVTFNANPVPVSDEQINGAAFLELTEQDLKDLKIKMEPRKKQLQPTSSTCAHENSIDDDLHIQEPQVHTEDWSNDPSPVFIDLPTTWDELKAIPSPTSDALRFSEFQTVHEILQSNRQGKQILEAIRKKEISEKDRRFLVRLVVGSLTKYCGNLYPSSEAKTALAKSIVTEFPIFRDIYSKEGYEYFFDPSTRSGFIEYRLVNLRRKLSPSQKRNKRKLTTNSGNMNKEEVTLDEHIINEKISMMKHKLPTPDNKRVIEEALLDTHNFRRNWMLSCNPTILQIMEKFPRLQDYNGYMIDFEFDILHPGKGENLISKFPAHYQNRILSYAQKNEPKIYINSGDIKNETMRALLVLAKLLSVSNAVMSNKGRKRPHDEVHSNIDGSCTELLHIVSEGVNISTYAASVGYKAFKNVQPYMIMQTLQNDVAKFYVQGDGVFLCSYDKQDATCAFNLLYKLYHVLNLEYPKKLTNFYNFMDRYIFDLNVAVKSSVSSLHTHLLNNEIFKLAGQSCSK